jgi:hypothetical protein
LLEEAAGADDREDEEIEEVEGEEVALPSAALRRRCEAYCRRTRSRAASRSAALCALAFAKEPLLIGDCAAFSLSFVWLVGCDAERLSAQPSLSLERDLVFVVGSDGLLAAGLVVVG